MAKKKKNSLSNFFDGQKELAIGIIAVVAVFAMVFTYHTFANDNSHEESESHNTLNWQAEVNPLKCQPSGGPVINAVEKVTNDADSGFAGYWAFDTYTRQIQVWPQKGGTYCATVSYEGKFNAQKGQTGPGGTGTIGSNFSGEMQGGYRSTSFTGTLKSKPTWPKFGFVGKVDYKCDLQGNCPGNIDWTSVYFDNVSGFDLQWWGWIYRGGKHGTWINAISGSSGNIL